MLVYWIFLICVILIPFRIDKKFFEASKIVQWAVLIYDSQRNFPHPAYVAMVDGFLHACDEVG
jgi:hypothetical protein